ncbi:hypothetical protein GS597_09020 [Synechococcales cyanobacterium C]|uniref:Uncharacterized protein n=1 Tax=Petrachloros mirabilis ULC683 TaxID=2781853 RepID=A0A8K1ZYX3_9CYAN|nr:helix-turn-helix transcriptional regulator [Petrachloros mirabilis]NCJ06643.1 hypothetical protein [Petrachloros mirabilis ULC683]
MSRHAEIWLITEGGRKKLGQFIRETRKGYGFSQDDLIEVIHWLTGHRIGKATLSALERGNVKPQWDTLAILAASGRFKNARTYMPFTAEELFAIACERIDPGLPQEARGELSKQEHPNG